MKKNRAPIIFNEYSAFFAYTVSSFLYCIRHTQRKNRAAFMLPAVLRKFCFAQTPVCNVRWAASTASFLVSMCTSESLIMLMMKLTLACNIIFSSQTNSSNKKMMPLLLLCGDSRFNSIPKFVYKDGIVQWGFLRIRNERYGRFSLQEGSDQRRLSSLHDLHYQEISVLHALHFVVSSRQS
jgi:hypothetical protein